MPFAHTLSRIRGRWSYFTSLPAFHIRPLLTMWRAIVWRLKCALRWPAVVWMPAWQARVFLEPEWRGAGVTLFYVVREFYEPELTYLHRFLSPGQTVVDAGANCGLYTLAAAHFVGSEGRVLAFEPGSRVFGMLERSVTSNQFKQVQVFRCALGAEAGRTRLYNHPHGASSASLGHDTSGDVPDYEEIEIETLDATLNRLGLEQIDLLKMDVEGAEELILRGSRDLFARSKPVVFFEVNPGAIANLKLSVDGAWAFLAERGYHFFSLSAQGTLARLDQFSGEVGNVVGLHPARHEKLIAMATPSAK